MASQSFLVLSLLIVYFGAAMASFGPDITILPISNYNDEEVQFLGKFAVEEYNKKHTSELYFIKVVNGDVVNIQEEHLIRFWHLALNAKNCSNPGSLDSYVATVEENMYASGSSFSTDGNIYNANYK